jgi:hypothetical protein
LFHDQLNVILKDLVDAQLDGIWMNLSLDGGFSFRRVQLKCPVLCVVGDCKGNDVLAAKFGGHSTLARVSRACDCTLKDADNPKKACIFNRVTKMEEMYSNGNNYVNGLLSVSFHHVQNAWHKVDFGGSSHGIYGCTPLDLMHSLQHGLYMYIQEVIYKHFTPSLAKVMDIRIRELAKLRQSVARDFPRTDFTNGITNLTFKTCEEQSGCIFMLVVLLSMAHCDDVLGRLGERTKVRAMLNTMEKILCFEQWTKRESFWKIDDQVAIAAAEKAIQKLLALIKTNFPREEKQGWCLPKFHETLHLVRFINEFGAPRNFNTARPENHHIATCKKPAKTAQKRHDVFTVQCAERLADSIVVSRAARHMAEGKSPPLPENLRETSQSYFGPPQPDCKDGEVEEDGAALGSSLGASRFFLDKSSDGEVLLYLSSQRTSKNKPAKVFKNVPSALIKFLVGHFYQLGEDLNLQDKYRNLEFVSEYSRDGSRFRGHWDYRSDGPWNDWAYINWEADGLVPGQILMFAKYTSSATNTDSSDDDDDDGSIGNAAGDGTSTCYDAIIIPGVAVPRRETNSTLLTKKFKLDMKRRTQRLPAGQVPPPDIPRYMAVNCTAIVEHCLVFPNIGADEHSMIVVDPIQEWSDKFMTINTDVPVEM